MVCAAMTVVCSIYGAFWYISKVYCKKSEEKRETDGSGRESRRTRQSMRLEREALGMCDDTVKVRTGYSVAMSADEAAVLQSSVLRQADTASRRTRRSMRLERESRGAAGERAGGSGKVSFEKATKLRTGYSVCVQPEEAAAASTKIRCA